MTPEQEEIMRLKTCITIGKTAIAYRNRQTPEGDEYARRALKALDYLRAGDLKQSRRWLDLIVVK